MPNRSLGLLERRSAGIAEVGHVMEALVVEVLRLAPLFHVEQVDRRGVAHFLGVRLGNGPFEPPCVTNSDARPNCRICNHRGAGRPQGALRPCVHNQDFLERRTVA